MGKLTPVIEAFTINDATGDLKTVNWKAINRNWDYLSGVNFLQVNSRNKIDMLIGVDYPDLHFSLKDIRGKPGQSIARLAPLGLDSHWKSKQNYNKMAPKSIHQNLS